VIERYKKKPENIEQSSPSESSEAVPKPPAMEDGKHRLAVAIPVDERELHAFDPSVPGNVHVRSRLTIAAGS